MVNFIDEGKSYKFMIDPLLKHQHKKVLRHIDHNKKIIDVACGTGALALKLANQSTFITGIDMSESMIKMARSTQQKQGIENIKFMVMDATDLSVFQDDEFDIGLISMAIHQFPQEISIQILRAMKRIAKALLILDYNHQMPVGLGKIFIQTIEWLAGGLHHRSFREYMKNDGIYSILDECGLTITQDNQSKKSHFSIVQCCQ